MSILRTSVLLTSFALSPVALALGGQEGEDRPMVGEICLDGGGCLEVAGLVDVYRSGFDGVLVIDEEHPYDVHYKRSSGVLSVVPHTESSMELLDVICSPEGGVLVCEGEVLRNNRWSRSFVMELAPNGSIW